MGIDISHAPANDAVRDVLAAACELPPGATGYIALIVDGRGETAAARLMTNSTSLDEVANMLGYFLIGLKGPRGVINALMPDDPFPAREGEPG